MNLHEILENNPWVPTKQAVSLAVYLEVIQNGYDISEPLTDVISRSTARLHEVLREKWRNVLYVEGPLGEDQRIPFLDYLGPQYSKEEFDQGYQSTDVNFFTLLEKYNQHLKSCNKPGIQISVEVDAGGKALRSSQKAKLKCQAIAQTLWHLNPKLKIEEIAKNHAIQEYGDGKMYRGKNTLRDWVSEVDPRPKEVKTGPRSKKKGV